MQSVECAVWTAASQPSAVSPVCTVWTAARFPSAVSPAFTVLTAASQPSAVSRVCSLDSCKSAQCSQPSVYSLDSCKSAQCSMHSLDSWICQDLSIPLYKANVNLINVQDQRNSTLYHAVQCISPSYTYQRHRPASVALAPSLTWTPASFPVCHQPVSILSQTVQKFHKTVPLIQPTIPAFAKHQPCNNKFALKVSPLQWFFDCTI